MPVFRLVTSFTLQPRCSQDQDLVQFATLNFGSGGRATVSGQSTVIVVITYISVADRLISLRIAYRYVDNYYVANYKLPTSWCNTYIYSISVQASFPCSSNCITPGNVIPIGPVIIDSVTITVTGTCKFASQIAFQRVEIAALVHEPLWINLVWETLVCVTYN